MCFHGSAWKLQTVTSMGNETKHVNKASFQTVDLFPCFVCYPSVMDNIPVPAGSRCVDILAEKVRWGLVVRKVGSGWWLRTGVWRSNLRWLGGGRYCRAEEEHQSPPTSQHSTRRTRGSCSWCSAHPSPAVAACSR